jgi:hypothetical protein
MPLTVYFGDGKASWVRDRAVQVKPKCRHEVYMGGFVIARNTEVPTALATVGAGTCVIIVMHCGAGIGGLAHVTASDQPNVIVKCARIMAQQLGQPITRVLLIAGQIHQDATQQQGYQDAIANQLGYLGVKVDWLAPQNNVWGACYYLPLSEEVAFAISSVGDVRGIGGDYADAGISVHSYP